MKIKKIMCALLAFAVFCTSICTVDMKVEAKKKKIVYYDVLGSKISPYDPEYSSEPYDEWYNAHIHKIKITNSKIVLWGGMKKKVKGKKWTSIPAKKRSFKLSKNCKFYQEEWGDDGPEKKRMSKSRGKKTGEELADFHIYYGKWEGYGNCFWKLKDIEGTWWQSCGNRQFCHCF